MDAQDVKNVKDRNTLFTSHIEALRSNEWTRDAHLVLMCERSTGHESGDIKMLLDHYPNTSAYNQPLKKGASMKGKKGQVSADMIAYHMQAEKNPGFQMDVLMKNLSLDALRHRLARNTIYYLSNGVSANPWMYLSGPKEKFLRCKLELEDQMRRSKEIPLGHYKFDTQRRKTTWSGKTNYDGEIQSGYNDDLVVMLAVACHLWDEAISGYNQLPGFPYEKAGLRK